MAKQVRIKAGNDAERVMPDTLQTLQYIEKLSLATLVRVTFPSGAWKEFECGLLVNSGAPLLGSAEARLKAMIDAAEKADTGD